MKKRAAPNKASKRSAKPAVSSAMGAKKQPALSEGWVGGSGIALGFYAAYQVPRSPQFVFATIAGLVLAFTLLVMIRHLGEQDAAEQTVRFLARYVLWLLVGVLSFFALAILFGPYITGIDYPLKFF